MLPAVLYWFVVAVGLSMAAGTLLSLSHHPHWFIRGWDFPRTIIAGLAFFAGAVYALFFFDGQWQDWAFMAAVGACVGWQGYHILPYTPLAPVTVQAARRPDGDATLRLLTTNVQMENEQYDRWQRVVRGADPDVILAVEVDDAWAHHLDTLEEAYPYVVRQPQDNYYGMMLLSRLKLIDPTVRFLVQDDVPSIHTGVELPSGQRICLHGEHPRPPEPLRDQDATPRDAELVVLGREIDEQEEQRPTIVAGDLNDVAWSHTTDLFVRLSGLLDPRKGRGLFNTFDAKKPLLRFPLDHVFHSNEFKLVDLKRLVQVGSDHFPVCIELSYEPDAPAEQPEPEATSAEEEEADEKVDKAAREKKRGDLD